LCREEALALGQLMSADPALSSIRMIAILKESLVNADGSSEANEFRKYFPNGELYVDVERRFYNALGKRSFFSMFSFNGLSYLRQRANGVSEAGVQGNFNGLGTDPLMLGGVMFIDTEGTVRWSYQEGNGVLPFDDLEKALKAYSQGNLATSPPQDWLDSALSMLNWR